MISSRTSGRPLAALTAFLVFFPMSLHAQGKIQGQVVNGTTGKPAPNQALQLLMPRGGMREVATTTTDAQGRFVFPQGDIETNGFYLLQAVYQDVNYHAPVQFDSSGAADVNLTVYEASRTAPEIRIRSARLIVRAEGDKVRVQEMFAVRNPSNPPKSYLDPDGTFRFHLSKRAGEPTAAVAGLMNMPLPQAVQQGKAPGEYSINYALKPGLTVVMIAYEMDYSAKEMALEDSVAYPIDNAELFVSPPGLAVTSSLFKPAGTDSDTGSQKYGADQVKSDEVLEAKVSGEAAPSGHTEVGQGEPEVKILPNSMTRLGTPLLACFLLVLLWALGVRVAKEWPRWKERSSASPVQKELEAKVEALFNSLADLDELFAAEKIGEKQYWKERLELKARLVATFKKAPSLLESYATRNLAR